MIPRSLITAFAVLILSTLVGAQTTQPAADTIDARDPRVELRANQTFNRGEYAAALPLLQKLAEVAKDEPSRLGPLQEKIRVCQKALDSLKNGPTTAEASPLAANNDVPSDPETRKKHPTPQPGEVVKLTIKQLGNFQYDEQRGGNIPADVKGLSGSKVQLRGYMIPMDQAEHITQFALVPSLFSCCFGQPPQLQHTIVVSCPKGKAVGYSPDEIVVEGQLAVQEKRDDGYVVSLFEVTAGSVKVAAK